MLLSLGLQILEVAGSSRKMGTGKGFTKEIKIYIISAKGWTWQWCDEARDLWTGSRVDWRKNFIIKQERRWRACNDEGWWKWKGEIIVEVFQNKNQKDIETTEHRSEGKGHPDFLKAHSFFFFPFYHLGRGKGVLYLWIVSLSPESLALCVSP